MLVEPPFFYRWTCIVWRERASNNYINEHASTKIFAKNSRSKQKTKRIFRKKAAFNPVAYRL